ncbi:hypothetical protein IP76_10970 [Rhizobium sp. AAP43]|nr:hypothetical protein IP76_10970 [Rhizobium sp. AAP43]
MTASGGQRNKQTVAIVIVCFLYATNGFAEVCDKGGWGPASGPITITSEIAGSAVWSLIITILLSVGILKRWRWLAWPITLLSMGMVLLGLSDDPEDPAILSMIAGGCRTGSSGLIMSISFVMPLLIGTVVAALKSRLKSGTK